MVWVTVKTKNSFDFCAEKPSDYTPAERIHCRAAEQGAGVTSLALSPYTLYLMERLLGGAPSVCIP